MQFFERRQLAERIGQRGQLVVVESQLMERRQLAERIGQAGQAVIGQVQIPQLVQVFKQRGRNGSQVVVTDIQEVSEAGQFSERIKASLCRRSSRESSNSVAEWSSRS